jgi:putative phosphoesterase
LPRIAIISDTHGLLRPEAVAFLRGSDFIVHAGDIGNAGVLSALRALAPLTVVRGNNDSGPWADAIPESDVLQLGELSILVLHNLQELDLDPVAGGIRVVVSGHTHQPKIEERDGVLYVNPGSCGPRRFKLPIAVAEMKVAGPAVKAQIVSLDIADQVRSKD